MSWRGYLLAMSNNNDGQTPVDSASKGEEFAEAKPDRPPTRDEETAAERAAADVDVATVGKHYEEMMEVGANVEGEGQVEPGT